MMMMMMMHRDNPKNAGSGWMFFGFGFWDFGILKKRNVLVCVLLYGSL
jgi:hypothetical protein